MSAEPITTIPTARPATATSPTPAPVPAPVLAADGSACAPVLGEGDLGLAPGLRVVQDNHGQQWPDTFHDEEDPADLSTRDLRLQINLVFKALDTPHPAYGLQDRFLQLTEEIERRESAGRRRVASASGGTARSLPAGSIDDAVSERVGFRDHSSGHRFELFENGMLAGFVKYTLADGRIDLTFTQMASAFDSPYYRNRLLRLVFLNAHKRRLTISPRCPEAFEFLRTHHGFLNLLPARTRG